MLNTGSVYQRADGRWCAALQVNGRRKILYGKNEREAKKKLIELQGQLLVNGGLPDAGKRTMGDLLDLWLASTGPNLKPRTLAE
ncbi:MAG: site-specific integrase, partial [Dehalococcoidia bacterium]|nr:site-specific integrase [Dehalococcoidia bacterium]